MGHDACKELQLTCVECTTGSATGRRKRARSEDGPSELALIAGGTATQDPESAASGVLPAQPASQHTAKRPRFQAPAQAGASSAAEAEPLKESQAPKCMDSGVSAVQFFFCFIRTKSPSSS